VDTQEDVVMMKNVIMRPSSHTIESTRHSTTEGWDKHNDWFSKIVRLSCLQVDNQFKVQQKKLSAVMRDDSGATAAFVVMCDNGRMAGGGIVGDSEIVICNEGEPSENATRLIEQPHKLSNPTEKARIESVGGCVRERSGVERICLPGTITPVLAVSRSFGDLGFKRGARRQGKNERIEVDYVTAEPTFKNFHLKEVDFLVIASDGLWDCITPSQSIDFIRTRMADHADSNPKQALQSITDELVQFAVKTQGKTGDNVSVVVVHFCDT